jgi:hypothetical protein
MRSTGFKGAIALPIMLMCGACQASDPSPQVGFYKLDDQRITGTTDVTSPSAGGTGLQILVTVDTAGSVTDAQVLDNFEKLDEKPGLAAVRGWTFHPQSFEGKPVTAVGMVTVNYHAPEIPADTGVPFPDPAGKPIEIGLDRGACFGTCPDYHVTIAGDGTVRFTTDQGHFAGSAAQVHLQYNGNNVLLPGSHTAHIDPKAVAALLDQFRAAHFFGLKKEYVAGVTDNPTQRLSLTIGDQQKVVTDYVGSWVGMPRAARDLEDAIDTTAGTARWVDGNAETLATLEAEGFDFHSKASAEFAAAAAMRMAGYDPPKEIDALLLGLIDKGLRLDAPIGKTSVGAMLVAAAASAGDEKLFDVLARRGQLRAMEKDELSQSFVHNRSSPAIARARVAAGADPRTTGSNGNALNDLNGMAMACGGDDRKLVAMVKTLIDLGVPIEARSEIGWTPLMGCDSPEVARLLIGHGTNVNAKDKDGTTPVLATDDDRVALVLLRAGADPHVRIKEGSLRDQAIKQHMPATLAWLDAHGIR